MVQLYSDERESSSIINASGKSSRLWQLRQTQTFQLQKKESGIPSSHSTPITPQTLTYGLKTTHLALPSQPKSQHRKKRFNSITNNGPVYRGSMQVESPQQTVQRQERIDILKKELDFDVLHQIRLLNKRSTLQTQPINSLHRQVIERGLFSQQGGDRKHVLPRIRQQSYNLQQEMKYDSQYMWGIKQDQIDNPEAKGDIQIQQSNLSIKPAAPRGTKREKQPESPADEILERIEVDTEFGSSIGNSLLFRRNQNEQNNFCNESQRKKKTESDQEMVQSQMQGSMKESATLQSLYEHTNT